MISTILARAADEFLKSGKMSARPVNYHLHLNSIQNKLKTIFSLKNRFLHFNQNKLWIKDNFSETLLTYYRLKCTYLGKNSI